MNAANCHPGRLLDISGGFWQASALHAAVKLDVFSVIEAGNGRVEEVVAAIDADQRAAAMLLNAMCAMGLLRKDGDVYANTDESRLYLVQSSPDYIGYMIGHHHYLVAGWNRLDEAVRTGQPVPRQTTFDDPEVRRNFLMGMFNLASLLAPQVAERIDLTGRRRLLDLGGGPGTYAIHFCRQNATLDAVVFDRPTTRPFAEEIIARFGLSKRISFAGGDYTTDALPAGFDVVWLSHILHAESPASCGELLTKAYDALMPGGLICVHDFLLSETMDGPLFPALFSLNMLQGTKRGQAYSRGQVETMLAAAGFANFSAVALRSPNDSGIVVALKK